MSNPIRAIAYARVSTVEQVNEGISLSAQQSRLRAHCEASGWKLLDVVIDAGASAKNLHREGVQQILAQVRRRACDVVVVYKLDRMFRNATDALNTTKELERYGVGFVSLTENLDTSNAMGRFWFTLLAAMSEWERGMIADRTRDALASRRAQGLRVGNVPFGYDESPDGTLDDNDPELTTVKQMMEMRDAGLGYLRIANELNKAGIPSKQGGRWHAKTVRGVLLRSANIG